MVSIPFKRESISKGSRLTVSFSYATMSFNSLQTGKHIQSQLETAEQNKQRVMNKFQFPSNGKAYPKIKWRDPTMTEQRTFQFPSNGKAYPKWRACKSCNKNQYTFQFPSNGKAYPKMIKPEFENRYLVSIPFKRESISKGGYRGNSPRNRRSMFQFPSNGKAYPKWIWKVVKVNRIEFQFPSNGKAYPKEFGEVRDKTQIGHVSIPFKRESISKVNLRERCL